jgi:hypothetical protein
VRITASVPDAICDSIADCLAPEFLDTGDPAALRSSRILANAVGA